MGELENRRRWDLENRATTKLIHALVSGAGVGEINRGDLDLAGFPKVWPDYEPDDKLDVYVVPRDHPEDRLVVVAKDYNWSSNRRWNWGYAGVDSDLDQIIRTLSGISFHARQTYYQMAMDRRERENNPAEAPG